MIADLRFALKLIAKSPWFTVAAVLALGFGIGLSSAIFNAFSAVLLRPLPHFRDEHRLVFVNSVRLDQPDSYYELSPPDFLDLRAQAKSIEGLTTATDKTMIFTGGDLPERVLGSDISVEGFAMFGVQPVRGRLFSATDGAPGAPPVAILSYALWQRRFGGEDSVLNRVEILNGTPTTIIGVLPAGFAFPEQTEIWTPLNHKDDPTARGSHDLPGWARLRDGVTLDEARAELAGLAARLAIEHKSTNANKGFALRLIREEATSDTVLLLRLMLGAAIFVLLIACANVANLLLARAAARSHEIAIRVAVGATRGRIVRQMLTESLLLGLLGGAAGLIIAVWANSLLVGAIPAVHIPFWMKFDFDWRVFSFAGASAIASSLVFGVFPALQASRSTATELKDGTRAATGGRRALRLRQSLVVAQVALSAVLLIGAGLFVRSFLKVQNTPPGFDDHGVMTFRVGLPQMQFKDKEEIRRFFDQLTPRLAEVPGVEAVGLASAIPSQGHNNNVFLLEGQAWPKTIAEASLATTRVVSSGYFSALHIPIVQGRGFATTDRRETPRVAVVDQRFVQRWCQGQNPIGRRISQSIFGGGDPQWMTIVGIVGDVPNQLDAPYENGAIYRLSDQEDFNFASYLVRVTGDASTFGPALQQAVVALKPGIPIYYVNTLSNVVKTSYWNRRFFSEVFGVFGLGALFLAALGVYSVMAYSVTQRIPEIGVRMALGASPSDVLRLVSRQGLRLVATGLGLGVVAALGITHLLAGLLYGVSPSDPPTYFTLTLVLALVALVACWVPARRATQIDPLVALRSD